LFKTGMIWPGLDRLIDVGEGLRLDPLAGIDDQERAFAGGQGSAHLVGKIDMARRVHQVEDIGFAVLGPIFEADSLRLDRDAALALELHLVEHLLLHLTRLEPAGGLDQPVGQGRFPMVDMGDDREIADPVERSHAGASIGAGWRGINTGTALQGCERDIQRRRGRNQSIVVAGKLDLLALCVKISHRCQMQRIQGPNSYGKRRQCPHQGPLVQLDKIYPIEPRLGARAM
jgi:hypothetical protein